MTGWGLRASGSTPRRAAVVVGAILGLIALFPGVADAGQVSNVSAINSSPSSAAGALTDYTIAFKTSSTGGLSGTAGSKITITLPPGTELEESFRSGSVTDTTTHQQVGSCRVESTTTATCEISGAVAAENTVTVELDGVTNPSSVGGETLEVTTTSDTTPATSSEYTITTAGQTATPTVTDTTSAAGALTDYKITFATSATGGLSGSAGSEITIVFPIETELEGSISGTVTDTTTRQQVGDGSCTVFDKTVTCAISGNVSAGNTLAVELNHITNPTTPNNDEKLQVDTSSDTSATPSNNYSITTPNQPGPATVTTTPSPAAGALTDYTIAFKTSSTGGLSGTAGSKITITLPSGTGLEGSVSGTVTDTTTRQQVGSCRVEEPTTAICEISGAVAAENVVTVELDGVLNPSSVGGETLEVTTTSDTTPATSDEYSITAAGQTATPTVTDTTSAAGAPTDYKITFATSPTGGLSGTAGSKIAIVFPIETELEGSISGTVTDTTTRQQVGDGSCTVFETTVTCAITGNVTAGNTLAVELNHITNPTTPNNNETLKVNTTSDTSPATSNDYPITTPNRPSSATVIDTTPSPAAGALTDYTIAFKTSSTGGLSGTADSKITIALPSDTGLEASLSGTVTDTTTHQQVGSCRVESTTTAICEISGAVAAENTVTVELDGVTNPSSVGGETLEVTTTSDTTPATSDEYSITAAAQTATPTVTDTTSAAGALTDYKITFATSPTGALSATAGSKITIVFPSGTELEGSVSGSVTDTTTRQQVGDGSCTVFETTVTCAISGNVTAGNTLAVELNRVTNPTTPDNNETLKVSTSSDTIPATSNDYPITVPKQPSPATVTNNTPSSAAGALTDYTIAFKTSPTGALSYSVGSQITITFPSGTGLSSVSGSVTDDTSGQQAGYCSGSGRTATCQISGAVAAGDEVSVELDGVTNPSSAGGETLQVATTSDTTSATSNVYQITTPNQVGQPTVINNSPSSAPGALTVYMITFTTSPSGGLSNKAGSQITIVFPPGTGLGSVSDSAVTDNTSGEQVGYCEQPTGLTVTCTIDGTVAAGDSVTVELDGVTNPAAPAPATVKVSTTSDTAAATSAPYGVGAPVVVTEPASNVSQTTAFVTGTVNPEDTAVTDCHFEWGPSTSYGQTVACSQVVGSGSSAEPVTSALTGLTPDTTYHFRVVATNAGGASYGNDQMFSTPASLLSMSAPSVFVSAPAVVGSEGAVFSGVVDPAGLATTVYFEYGLDPKYSGGGPVSYDQSTPAQTVGSDFVGHQVSAPVSGLVSDAVYHVRLVAANGAGTTIGPDQTFTTGQGAAPHAPTVGQTVNLEPVKGLVLVKLPAGGAANASTASTAHDALTKGVGFIPLTQARQVPVGSEIDARRGILQLVVATGQRHRRTQMAKLSGALFTVTQQRTGLHKGLATFTLNEDQFPGAPSYASCAGANANASTAGSGDFSRDDGNDRDAQAATLSKRTVQTLDATDNNGDFRTRGRYSAATVRGTSWETSDRCDGTFTLVRRGIVDVLDFATRKTVVLHAGQSYLAPAP